MKKYVVRNEGFVDGRLMHNGKPTPKGRFLKSYDPEANKGMGRDEWTPDPTEAMRFESAVDAHRLWTAVPKSHPVRKWDGKPNRPLTAYSVTIMAIEDAVKEASE